MRNVREETESLLKSKTLKNTNLLREFELKIQTFYAKLEVHEKLFVLH